MGRSAANRRHNDLLAGYDYAGFRPGQKEPGFTFSSGGEASMNSGWTGNANGSDQTSTLVWDSLRRAGTRAVG